MAETHLPSQIDPLEAHACWVDASVLTADQAVGWVAVLPDEEQRRFHQYRRPLDAHMFLAGRLMARAWLSAVAGGPREAWRFHEGPHGRPEIHAPPTAWRFNLAHSAGLVVCVLARDREVGVDIEDLARRPVTPDLARRCCSSRELADIEAQPPELRSARFLTYWTLKEAYLKACGLGITVHMADVEFSFTRGEPRVVPTGSLAAASPDWAFHLSHPTPRHLLAVAARHPSGSPRPHMRISEIGLRALDPSV